MIKYLVDTNIIIYHLNGDATAVDWLQSYRNELAVSVISKIEVLSYPFGREEEALALRFLNQFELIHLSDAIIEATIRLRRQRKIKTPDAIIAATALVHGLCICTRNTKDFSGMGIEQVNPFS
jgi:predicted nucleic acid-binding protein